MLRAKLAEVLTATRAYTIVHCCASGYPFEIINGARADAVSFDLSLLGHGDYDTFAETVEGARDCCIGALSVPGPVQGSARSSYAGCGQGRRTDSGRPRNARAGRRPGGCGGRSGFPRPASRSSTSSRSYATPGLDAQEDMRRTIKDLVIDNGGAHGPLHLERGMGERLARGPLRDRPLERARAERQPHGVLQDDAALRSARAS